MERKNYGTIELLDQDNRIEPEITETRLYKRRWIMLIIFASYSAANGFQWNQYATISDVIAKFYQKSLITVDWLSISYLVVYTVFIVPANWFLAKYGMVTTAAVATALNAGGAWIKVTSCRQDLFWVTISGQVVAAMAQLFLLGIPAQLAAVWFGAKEVSVATSLGVIGNQFGVALGFLLPPLFVPKPDPWNQEMVAKDMKVMFYLTAIVTTIQFVLVLIVYEEKPPVPPSRAQAAASDNGVRKPPLETLKELFTNRGFVLLLLTYGINTGIFHAIATLLNNVITLYYRDAEKSVGYIGLLIVLSGMVGSLLIGFWLDKTHRYKITAFVVYIFICLFMVVFTVVVIFGNHHQIWPLYIIAASLGFFMTGYLPLGFEFAAEITYPISVGMTSGLLNASAQGIEAIIIIGAQELIDHVIWFNKKALSGLLLFILLLIIGCVLTAFIKEEHRRQRTERTGSVQSLHQYYQFA